MVTDIDVDAHNALARDLRLIISDIRRLDVAFLHVDAEGQLHSAFKLRAMSRSPYARTVYLDKDTRVCASLTGAFDLLPRYDFVATQAAAAFYEGGPDPWTEDSGLYPVPPSFIQFCAAVIFYRRSARVSGMFRLAISEADRLHPSGFLDQAALRNALYHAPSVRTFALTPSWQCRGAHSCRTSFASPQVVTDRQISGKFPGQRCIVLHQHALQDADPRQPLTGSWATSPVVRARFAWDQGLYTNELLPRGIPSRHHYLRSQSSALYHDMLAFSDAWLPEALRARAPEGPVAVLGVANADFVRLRQQVRRRERVCTRVARGRDSQLVAYPGALLVGACDRRGPLQPRGRPAVAQSHGLFRVRRDRRALFRPGGPRRIGGARRCDLDVIVDGAGGPGIHALG